jgi:hypothetical protein
MITVPKAEELTSYYQSYLKYIPTNSDLLLLIKEQALSTQQFIVSIPKEKENYAYAEGKWMAKEVIGHLCDTERILSSRAVCFSRNDKTPLPGFDENTYMLNSNYASRSLKNIAEEFAVVRQSSVALFANMNEDMFERKGTANNNSHTVRHMLFFILGHERHHLEVIKEKYLNTK